MDWCNHEESKYIIQCFRMDRQYITLPTDEYIGFSFVVICAEIRSLIMYLLYFMNLWRDPQTSHYTIRFSNIDKNGVYLCLLDCIIILLRQSTLEKKLNISDVGRE